MPGAETFLFSADAYERHVGRYGAQLAAALIGVAGVEHGMRALDVGCDTGALTTVLADRLGTDRVTGVDPSPAFVNACLARLPGVEVALAGAERLPFEDGAFDVVLSQLVVNFMRDPVKGVREMERVARPGGIVASCVWDYAGEMMLLRAYWDAARDVAPEAAAASDEGTVMRWCGEGELAELWQAAGLRDVRFQPLIVRARYSNFEDLWSPFPRGVAPSGVFCKTLSDQDRAALHDAYRRRLGVGDQPFELTARAWSVAGRAPESCSLTRLEVPLWSSHAHLPRLSGSLELRGLRDDVGYARARAGSPTRRWRIRGVAGGLGDVPCFRFGADARI